MHRPIPFLTVIIFLFLLISCTKADIEPSPVTIEPEIPKGNEKEITSFAFLDSSKKVIPLNNISITLTNDTFYVVFPYGISLAHLYPTITIKGVSIEPASGEEQSFVSPVEYTVTAEDSTTKKYVVVASVKKFSAVYFGSYNGHLYALDPESGSLIWKYKVEGGNFAYSDPLIANNVIYAGSINGYMYAWDAITGEVKWAYYAGGTSIESPPAIHNGMLYFGGSNDFKYYALDAATGELKWTYQTQFNISTRGVFYNGNVIFGSSDGKLYALDAATGDFKWYYHMGGMCNQSSPVINNGVIFIGSRNQTLHAINASDGSVKWTFSGDMCSMEQSTPFVHNEKVYIGSWYNFDDFKIAGSMYCVDEHTGQLIWKALDELGVGGSPVVGENKLFISPDDGSFYALDAETGTFKWSRQIYPNGSTAAVHDGVVYVGGTGTNFIYALDAGSGLTKWKFPLPEGGLISAPVLLTEVK